MTAERERAEIVRLVEESGRGRSLEVKLFAAELAGRIRSRSVPPAPERISLTLAAQRLGICRGKISQLVYDKVLPEPVDGTFARDEIERIRAWLSPYLAASQFEKLARLRDAVRARELPGAES
jgi:hypothetical protein